MKIYKEIILIVLTTLLINGFNLQQTYSQQDNGMYFMKLVPQNNYLNPAIQNDYKFYLGAPMLSSMHYNFNSGLSFNDVIYYDNELDSVVLFLASEEYQDNFIKKLNRSKNLIGFENHISIGSIGFRVNDIFINLDIQTKMDHSMNLPADMAEFILNGNYDYINDKYLNYDLSKFDINASVYQEYSVGASYPINEQLTVGARPKLIFGLYNISTTDQNITLNSSSETLSLNADITLNAAIPGLQIEYDEEGLVDSLYPSEDMGKEFSSGLFANKGLGLDLGAVYKFDDKITFYGSLIDLGWIRWKNNANNFSLISSYDFGGIDASDFITKNKDENTDETDTSNFGSQFLDTLKEAFEIHTSQNPYTTGLSPKLYLGGTYKVHEKIELGVLSRSQIYNGRFKQQLTLSANFMPLKFFNATVSYTIRNFTFDNFGYGLAYKFGPFNTYVIIDKSMFLSRWDEVIAPDTDTPIPIPHNFKKYSIRFGANLIFGSGDKDKSLKSKGKKSSFDKPIIH